MKNAKPHTTTRLQTRGFTLIASLLMLLLLSGIAIGLMMMVNTEGKVGSTDLQNNGAFHAAEGGIEKMASDLSSTFQNAQSPQPSQICAVSGSANQPSMVGVSWKDYSLTAAGIVCPAGTGTLQANWGQISGGPNQGLWAQIIPVSMLATAAMSGGQEVSMTRSAQVALIPVFQFGVFCDGDCGFFDSPNLTFAGRVHTNADLYLGVSGGSTLTFNNKLEAYGNIVTEVLPNGLGPTGSGWDDTGNVYIPTAVGGCSTTTTSCKLKDANGSSTYGDGSVQGAGGNPEVSTYNTATWNAFSKATNSMIINGNYGSTTHVGTGAKQLSMPFVSGTTHPYEIIRRPLSTDSGALTDSREYNMAQIHVLLSDDPADLPGGNTDTNNVRLANVVGASYSNPYGIATSHTTETVLTGGSTYNTYFATASNAIPSASCTSTSCTPDWPYPPAPFTAAMMTAVGAGTDSNCVLLCPTGAPFISNNGSTVAGASALGGTGLSTNTPPPIVLCPPATPAPLTLPTGCPASGTAPTFPYYLVNGSSTFAEASADTNTTATWNLIDGWLRVEYRDSSGVWHPVTNEWLQLGFARGLTPPTGPGGATGANTVNPDAILLLQEPADRVVSGTIPTLRTTATAPTCNTTSSGKCATWSATLPQQLVDTTGSLVWQYGVTTSAMKSALASSTLTAQSLSRFNWYPINFYDAREGEPRDTVWSSLTPTSTYANDNTCTAMGVVNAVEIDVGNLNRWLNGVTGTSGSGVDTVAQNGYVLYFSDRRGMLPNVNFGGTSFTKSGDSGFEDVINANGPGDTAAGAPDAALEPIPSGKSVSPEDVNQNGLLDNFGTANLGLGFYGTGANTAINLNYFITSANPDDPYGTSNYNKRIQSCTTARKNWVSGARHVLKLVDGSLANVPNNPTGTSADPGGFTVASENPVYIQGDYNSNSGDNFWPSGVQSGVADKTGHSAAAVIADAVTLLSNNWVDQYSTMGNSGASGGNYSPTQPQNNRPASTTYYRVAIAGGKNIAFPFPSWENATSYGFGTDGGIHNFLRFLEDWNNPNATLNYGGSLVSLYYSTYSTGVFKCCSYSVYQPPSRNYIFDADFTLPSGLPPGTPMFRDVETLSYRQLFTNRTY